MNKVIHNAGKSKLQRWRIALHESAHSIAFLKIGGVGSRSHVFRAGAGLCHHGIVPDPLQDAVCVAVAKYAEFAPGWALNPPTVRIKGTSVRRSRCRPRRKVESDEKVVSAACRLAELEFKTGQTRRLPFSADDIEREAQLFIADYRNAGEILALAKRLYRDGKASVFPERTYRNQPPADVPPAIREVVSMPADAGRNFR